MKAIVIILYIVCFSCYILFTRQPDYFDGEQTKGWIIQQNGKLLLSFLENGKQYYVPLTYPFLHHRGEQVKVIYEGLDPNKAKVYKFIGYWITFGELFASIFIVVVLYWISTAITKNPTPEALIEELEMGKKKPRKPKYDH